MNIKKFNFKEKWAIIDRLFKNMDNDHISEYSAQCSYYTILSFIPFIILLITMIQYTSIEQQALLEAISKIIPASMNEMVLGIVREVYSKSIGTISISIIFTLWSAGKGLYALTKGLQGVYKVNSEEANKCNIFTNKSNSRNNYIHNVINNWISTISIWKELDINNTKPFWSF